MSKSKTILKTLIGNSEKIYEGRFVGFLKDDEFNALIQHQKDVAGRLESKPTQSVVEVARSSSGLPGTRLVMVIRKNGSKTVVNKTLFVSQRCDYASSISDNEVVIQMIDSTDQLVIEEVKNDEA